MEDPAEALVFYVVFVFSVTFHEAAHAYLAMRGGDLTAYHGGQVSLSPVPHIRREPIGMVVLPIATTLFSGWPIGYASAPYDPLWAERHPRRAAWMSLAGPAANAFLVLVALLVLRAGLGRGFFAPPQSVSFAQVAAGGGSELAGAVALLVSVFFSMNLLLALLNLLPLPPLDGAGALGLVLPEQTARRFQHAFTHTGLGVIGILIAWRLIGEIFWPVFLFAVSLVYRGALYG
jgi:Zn-dependent protease